MSHGSLSPVQKEDGALIATAGPLNVSGTQIGILWFLVGFGLLSFFVGIFGEDPIHGWAAFHVNFVFWLVAAGSGTVFAAVLHLCNAQWSRPVRRIFESSTTFFSICVFLLAVDYIGHSQLFSWSHEHVPGKGIWLTSNFVYARLAIGLCILVWLFRSFVHRSIKRDVAVIRAGLTGAPEDEIARWNASCYDACHSDAVEDDVRDTTDRMWRLSPAMVILYAVVMTMVAFDLVMSVDPHWYSTLFGALIFMSGIYMAMAWCGISLCLLREANPIFKLKVERRTLHDLGKLLFGFGIFWAYMFWSHYLPIWYGNLPEETAWVIVRLREEPWHYFAWVCFGATWVIPFLLGLSRDVKQAPQLLFATGVIAACGLWLQFYLLFVPTLYPHEIPLSWIDFGIMLGFMGGYFLCQIHFLSRVPLMPFGDLHFYAEEVRLEDTGEEPAHAA